MTPEERGTLLNKVEVESRNSILMTCDHQDLDSTSDWSCREQIRSTIQIWSVTRHQYGISALSRRSSDVISRETSDGVTKCQLFSQAKTKSS